MKLNLDPWQREFLNTKGDKILCTGRQVGKSEICAEDAGEYAVKNPNSQPIVMIAPTERQAYALFEKTLNFLLDNYKSYVQTSGKDKPTQSKITMKSGVKIYCIPVGISGLGIRFITVGRLYVDEASRINEDVWTAILPALLTTGGDSIYLSTPFGAKGEFYNVWENKDGAYSSFKRFSIDSEKCMREREVCETWTQKQRENAILKIEQAKARMSKLKFAQEYLGQFLGDIKQYFPNELIKSCMKIKRGEIQNTDKDNFCGVDVAHMGEDIGVILAVKRINRERIRQIDMEILDKKRITETAEAVKQSDRKHNYRKIYIDATGVGAGVFDICLKDKQTKRKVIAFENATRNLDNEDNQKIRITKEDSYGNLLTLMEQGKVELFNEVEILYSLQSIQYEYVNDNIKISGDDSHIAEALVRAAHCIKDKGLKVFARAF